MEQSIKYFNFFNSKDTPYLYYRDIQMISGLATAVDVVTLRQVIRLETRETRSSPAIIKLVIRCPSAFVHVDRVFMSPVRELTDSRA